jgi:hypothetical protein
MLRTAVREELLWTPKAVERFLLKKHIGINLIQNSSCVLRLSEPTDKMIWHLEVLCDIHTDNFLLVDGIDFN